MKSTGKSTGSRVNRAEVATILAMCIAACSTAACTTSPKTGPTARTLQGVVFDLDRSPVPGAVIEMKGKSGTAQTTTDAQGRFFIPLVETGDYTLSFAKAMYETMIRSIAIDNFAEVLYLQTASYWQLLDAALAALGKKDLGRAEEYLSRAKTIQSQSATSLFLDAVVAELRGDYEVAVRAMERSVEIDPRSAFSWLYLADLYERSGAETDRIARALEAYLKLRDDPVAAEREKRLLHR